MPNTPRKIIIHHSAAVSPTPQFSAINQWHKEREFPISKRGFYVGYHYVIEKSGQLMTARNEDEIGAHTIGENGSSIGICLAGNFDIEQPTAQQVATLGDMLTSLCMRYQLTDDDIYPHRCFKSTSCYGKLLGNNWAARVYLEHEIKRFQLKLDALPAD